MGVGQSNLWAFIHTRLLKITTPSSALFLEDSRLDVNALKNLAPDHRAVKRSKFVKLNSSVFMEKTSAGKDKIKNQVPLNLFSDKSFIAQIEKSKEIAPRTLLAKGKIANIPMSDVTILYKDGRVTGHIRTSETTYEIRHVQNGVHVVREIDPRRFKEVHPPSRRDARPLREVLRPSQIMSTEPIIIDLLAVYTTAAKDAVGGEQNVKDLIDFAIAETNLAYENSNVYQRLNLVESREVSYTESGDSETDINRLMGKTDGYLDAVHSLRDQYGADFVALFASGFETFQSGNQQFTICGRSNPMDSTNYTNYESLAFVVVDLRCGTIYTLAHELGHDMGTQHDAATAGGDYQGLYYYSFGYQDPQSRFRTIMAYDCPSSCPRVPFFSNPRVNFNNWSTGIIDQADNSQTLNNTREIVAGLRSRTVSLESIQALGRILATTTQDRKQTPATISEITQVIADTVKTYLPFASSSSFMASDYSFEQTFISEHALIEGISFVISKNNNPQFLVKVGIADETFPRLHETLTFTTLDPLNVPVRERGRSVDWTRVNFREPVRVVPRQKYFVILHGLSTNSSRNYSLGVGANTYRFGRLTINDDLRGNPTDLVLKIHYRVPQKKL